MSKHGKRDCKQVAQFLGVQPLDAARRILEAERAGKQVPRRLRRAARAIVRGASDSEPSPLS
jgi:hypothetical protein